MGRLRIIEADSIWDVSKMDMLETGREEQRKRKGRLTFDCRHAKSQGDWVICEKYELARSGHMSLLSVLRGRTAKLCKSCLDFDGDD